MKVKKVTKTIIELNEEEVALLRGARVKQVKENHVNNEVLLEVDNFEAAKKIDQLVNKIR